MWFSIQGYNPSLRQYFILNVSLVSTILGIEGRGLDGSFKRATFYEKVSRDMNDESDL